MTKPDPLRVTVREPRSIHDWDDRTMRWTITNPLYAGVGPTERVPVVSDATWIDTAARLIADEGAEQFLVNLLAVLRECLRTDRERPPFGWRAKPGGEWGRGTHREPPTVQ